MKINPNNCTCVPKHPQVLQFQMKENPLICSYCNLKLPADTLNNFDRKKVKDWVLSYQKAYTSWLNSEASSSELSEPKSILNAKGRSLAYIMNKDFPTYYWLHSEENVVHENCPNCERDLIKLSNSSEKDHHVCLKCMILLG